VETNELQLIIRAQNGDQEAYGELVAPYQDRLTKAMCRILRPYLDGPDIAQEAFTTGWVKIRAFRGESKFWTWIYRIAVNKALDFRKKADSRSEEQYDETCADAKIRSPWGGGSPDFFSGDCSAHNSETYREEQEKAWREIAPTLSPLEQKIVWLRFAQDRSAEEINEILGSKLISMSRIYRICNRVREHCRKALKQGEGAEGVVTKAK
jgi:RNA polymerase sigma-70 factor, ECF subfamily